MDISHVPAIERVARVLAAHRLSANADGAEPHAGPQVDAAWPHFRDEAIAVLKTLREPDTAMATAGDTAVWENMILAALGEHKTPVVSIGEAPEPGANPFHEGP